MHRTSSFLRSSWIFWGYPRRRGYVIRDLRWMIICFFSMVLELEIAFRGSINAWEALVTCWSTLICCYSLVSGPWLVQGLWQVGVQYFSDNKDILWMVNTHGWVCRSVVDVLDNVKICIPLSIFKKITPEWMHKDMIHDLHLSISLPMEGCGEFQMASQ